ncbi:hypothetical protein ES707_20339 [subsurface metagenome]
MANKTSLKIRWAISVFLLWFGCTIAAGEVIYVDIDRPTGGNGTSWGTAYKYLQDALYKPPTGGDQIWVAEGTYKPDENTANPGGTGSRTATFQLINGVAIYGGFAGTETTLAQRDWQTNETILSGDLDGNDVGFTNNGENSYHVVTGSGTNDTALLDGFTITAGNANGSWPNNLGGGMYNDNGSPTVTNCTFSGNSAEYLGGGMYNYNYSSPTLTNCTFSGNSAGIGGGGMYNYYYTSPTVTNCTFSSNSAGEGGGGMWNGSGSPALTNCTFSANSAGYDGGGMYNYSSSSPTVTNCTFSGNSANYNGGGMFNFGNNPTLTNCTFSGNSAGIGGGMSNRYKSSPTVSNCILWGDTAGTAGAEIALADSAYPSTLTISYSDVEGGSAAAYVETNCTLNWGVGNIDADPMFFDASNPDPSLRDYHLRPGSPCIDAGDNNSIPADTADLDNDGNTTEPLPFDIDTDVRISGGIVDMGSDEAIWAIDQDVGHGEEVILNPGGGGTDPNTEALVVFENVSGPNDATIEVTEVGTDLYPDGLFRALGTTIRIDTSLADGEFFMTVSIPFDSNDLAGEDPFGVDLMYWEQPPGKWRHAVKANTDPQQSNPKKLRWQEEYPPTSAPSLAELKARGMGANGVFWNSDTQQGFVWANVDHTTDFEGLAHNIADFEPDGNVDFVDFAWFAPNWLNTGCGTCSGADLTGDGNVDSYDLKEFADNWLLGVE